MKVSHALPPLLAVLAAPAASAQTLAFTDVTSAAGIDSTYNPGTFAHHEYCGGGAAGDLDRDGWQDLFLLGGLGQPDRLYINNGDGTFTDQAAAWGIAEAHDGRGVAVGDYDGDGWLDLFVTSSGTGTAQPGKHRLYHNGGDGTFTDVAPAAGVAFTHPTKEDGFGAAFGDYDLDGDLDLFVAGFRLFNAGSRLFQNQGDGTFLDVTAASKIFAQTPSLSAFAPRFCDMDGDRYPELLLAADFGTSRYFKNEGDGTFTDWTDQAGLGKDENGMGQTIADWNRDGRADWYVSSIFLPTSGWTGNKLYDNQGSHSFVERSAISGVDDGGWGWGTVGVDLDHDGWEDLAETNGASGWVEFDGEQSYLWISDGQGLFAEVALQVGFAHSGEGRGLLNLDLDGDGDEDLVVIGYREPTRLFRNDLSGPATHWLRVVLDTRARPGLAPDGYGSRVVVAAGGQVQTRWLVGGDNFLSQNELSVHFGLGGSTTVDSLTVHWSDGTATTLLDVPADQTLGIAAGTPFYAHCACVSGAPCGNASAGTGCANSLGGGARLEPLGTASVSADDLVLVTTGLPANRFGLTFMGPTTVSPKPLGDGLRCTGGSLWRFPVRSSGATGRITEGPGIVAWTQSHFPPSAWISAGHTWSFQTWYRDPGGPCGSGSNVSNALSVTFAP